MFGFQVVDRYDPEQGSDDETPRIGSVCTMPYVLGTELVVAVMWDDDLTIDVYPVAGLQAVGVLGQIGLQPEEPKKVQKEGNIYKIFQKPEDDEEPPVH